MYSAPTEFSQDLTAAGKCIKAHQHLAIEASEPEIRVGRPTRSAAVLPLRTGTPPLGGVQAADPKPDPFARMKRSCHE